MSVKGFMFESIPLITQQLTGHLCTATKEIRGVCAKIELHNVNGTVVYRFFRNGDLIRRGPSNSGERAFLDQVIKFHNSATALKAV